jgi:hypothetical protein
MRRAMIALSSGERPQPLRQIFTVSKDQKFGTMPGELARRFRRSAAKLISVFDDPDRPRTDSATGRRGRLMMEKPARVQLHR